MDANVTVLLHLVMITQIKSSLYVSGASDNLEHVPSILPSSSSAGATLPYCLERTWMLATFPANYILVFPAASRRTKNISSLLTAMGRVAQSV
jgi:hypothetical protein